MSENVKGLKRLLKVIDKLPKELDNDVESVLEPNAQEIEAEAKRIAPFDTGKLRQSIKATKSGDKSYKIAANATGLAPYAPFVEYGTRFQRAQPYLFPAFFKGRERFTSDLEDLLEDTFNGI